MINYDPEQPDSLFLSADTLWLYTIPVLPPVEVADSTAVVDDAIADSVADDADVASPNNSEISDVEGDDALQHGNDKSAELQSDVTVDAESTVTEDEPASEMRPKFDTPKRSTEGKGANLAKKDDAKSATTAVEGDIVDSGADIFDEQEPMDEATSDTTTVVSEQEVVERNDSLLVDSMADTLADSTQVLTAKQLRYRAKLEKRRVRDYGRRENCH
jgi:hypothetical protein